LFLLKMITPKQSETETDTLEILQVVFETRNFIHKYQNPSKIPQTL